MKIFFLCHHKWSSLIIILMQQEATGYRRCLTSNEFRAALMTSSFQETKLSRWFLNFLFVKPKIHWKIIFLKFLHLNCQASRSYNSWPYQNFIKAKISNKSFLLNEATDQNTFDPQDYFICFSKYGQIPAYFCWFFVFSTWHKSSINW